MYYYKIKNGYMCVPTPRSGYEEITQEEYESHILPVQEQPENIPAPPTAEDRISALEEQNEMLLECLLEMSEIIYA